MTRVELVLTVSSPQELDGTDLRPYDAVCLGNPYCRRVAGNYADDFAALADAVSALHRAGRKAYVTSPAAPRGRDLPRVEALIDAAAANGADALEVHNMGVLRILREKGNPLPAHMGAFANVYTHLAARVMRDFGAARVRPNAEVSLEEMRTIAAEGEVEILVHGKIPLGVNEACFLLSAPEGEDPNCPAACREEHWLSARREGGRDGGWVLKTVGKGILSGKDMCMIEHLPRLLADGFRVFRIEGLYETAAWRSEIGAVYRQALDAAASPESYAVRPDWAAAIRGHSRHGVCNGYCFGKTGRLYVGTVLQGEKS